MTVVMVKDALDLEAHWTSCEALAASMPEPNPFYEPWMLLPALRNLAADPDLLFLLLYAPDEVNLKGPPILCGFFPMQRVKRYKGLPCHAMRLWQHVHCYECTPLVRPGYAEAAVRELLHWLASHSLGTALLELPNLTSGSLFHQALVDYLHDRDTPQHTLDAWTRALWKPRADGDAYLLEAMVHKRRKEFKRLERRLGELGLLEVSELEHAEEVGPWVEEFLALEASGWKGQDGGALARNNADGAFFRDLIVGAFARDRLLLSALRLDGKAVAMKCSFRAGGGAYAFKIAFDEHYARFSPGVLLELDNIHRLHGKRGISWMDSCAVPDHVMINRLWVDRRNMHSILVATGRRGSHLLLALVPLMKWVKSLFRRLPKSVD